MRRRLIPWEILANDPLVDRFSSRDGHVGRISDKPLRRLKKFPRRHVQMQSQGIIQGPDKGDRHGFRFEGIDASHNLVIPDFMKEPTRKVISDFLTFNLWDSDKLPYQSGPAPIKHRRNQVLSCLAASKGFLTKSIISYTPGMHLFQVTSPRPW